MFVTGTTPFVGDYIDIASQNIIPSGSSWVFNTQGTDSTGATNAPDFHFTWTDNRDVVPPPVMSGVEDWTKYVPPNSGFAQTSTYSGTGNACPTCMTTQPACATVPDDNGTPSAYSGDRNQNVYTSRVTNGLVVRFRENSKPLSKSITTFVLAAGEKYGAAAAIFSARFAVVLQDPARGHLCHSQPDADLQ